VRFADLVPCCRLLRNGCDQQKETAQKNPICCFIFPHHLPPVPSPHRSWPFPIQWRQHRTGIAGCDRDPSPKISSGKCLLLSGLELQANVALLRPRLLLCFAQKMLRKWSRLIIFFLPFHLSDVAVISHRINCHPHLCDSLAPILPLTLSRPHLPSNPPGDPHSSLPVLQRNL
jgi:hypothetical protein